MVEKNRKTPAQNIEQQNLNRLFFSMAETDKVYARDHLVSVSIFILLIQ